MTCHVYFKWAFFQLYVIIEHNLVVFIIFVLNVFEVVEAQLPKIETRCSYKIVLIF